MYPIKSRKSVWTFNGKNWYDRLKTFLPDENFRQSKSDPCFCVKRGDSCFMYVLVWVKCIIVASSDLEQIRSLKEKFKQNFRNEEKGELRWFLGIKIVRKPGDISVDQEQYSEDLLKKQGMSNCNLLKIPATVNENFVKAYDKEELSDATSYRSLIGTFLFLAKQTRPVYLYGLFIILSFFIAKPEKVHMRTAEIILRYLRGTSELKIVYRKQKDPVLLGESHEDWSGDQKGRKSTAGFYFKYGQHSGAISWQVRK